MKRESVWRLLACFSAGTLLNGGCVDGLKQAFYVGAFDYVSGGVTTGLSNAFPLELFFSDLVRDLLSPTV
jgi:hypothetical protein